MNCSMPKKFQLLVWYGLAVVRLYLNVHYIEGHKKQTFVNNSPAVVGGAFKLDILTVLMNCSMPKTFQLLVWYDLAVVRL